MKVSRVDRRREEILGASYELFGDRGYHDTNIADIAAVLGLGHGTFYRYFKNKRDIFDAVVDQVLARIAAAVSVEPPDEARTLAEYRAQIGRIGEHLFDLFGNDPRLSRILFFEAPGIDDAIDRKLERGLDLFADVTRAYLENGRARGFLSKRFDTRAVAEAINAMIFEGVRRVLASKNKKKAKQLWIDTVTILMLDGLAS